MNWQLLIDNINERNRDALLDYTANEVLKELCRINQFYSFDSNSQNRLRVIYLQLLIELESMPEVNTRTLKQMQCRHLERLKRWLKISNPFSSILYSLQEEMVENPVINSEYSASLQVNVLKININKLKQPVLDIGCSPSAKLVTYLNELSIDAYGIDRFPCSHQNCFMKDWMDFDFGINRWGTIISNLGFSNHFMFHHLHNTGKHQAYAKKFMEILHSLKPGGSFYYAPSLPFIEGFLSEEFFHYTRYKMQAGIPCTVMIRRTSSNIHF